MQTENGFGKYEFWSGSGTYKKLTQMDESLRSESNISNLFFLQCIFQTFINNCPKRCVIAKFVGHRLYEFMKSHFIVPCFLSRQFLTSLISILLDFSCPRSPSGDFFTILIYKDEYGDGAGRSVC